MNERTLYVGKTNKDFFSRLKAHLGLGSKKTFALHLNSWAGVINLELELHYAQVRLSAEDIRYLEQMENVLHESLHPILGRSAH